MKKSIGWDEKNAHMQTISLFDDTEKNNVCREMVVFNM